MAKPSRPHPLHKRVYAACNVCQGQGCLAQCGSHWGRQARLCCVHPLQQAACKDTKHVDHFQAHRMQGCRNLVSSSAATAAAAAVSCCKVDKTAKGGVHLLNQSPPFTAAGAAGARMLATGHFQDREEHSAAAQQQLREHAATVAWQLPSRRCGRKCGHMTQRLLCRSAAALQAQTAAANPAGTAPQQIQQRQPSVCSRAASSRCILGIRSGAAVNQHVQAPACGCKQCGQRGVPAMLGVCSSRALLA